MLLNVELMADGTIAPSHKQILDEIGQWVNINSKAIYGSKPWKVYGDNLNSLSTGDRKKHHKCRCRTSTKKGTKREFQCPYGKQYPLWT